MTRWLLSLSAVALAAAAAQSALAQETVTFTCLAPAGHVCQFAVHSAGQQINFALPSGAKKDVPGVTPRIDTYCVCDPGPVTPDCKQPRLDHWCLGSWAPVQPGVNSKNDIDAHAYAIGEVRHAD
jgi:hypothetical protein